MLDDGVNAPVHVTLENGGPGAHPDNAHYHWKDARPARNLGLAKAKTGHANPGQLKAALKEILDRWAAHFTEKVENYKAANKV